MKALNVILAAVLASSILLPRMGDARADQTAPTAGGGPDAAVPTDVLGLDTPHIRYFRSGDGVLHARVFTDPIGVAGSSGWQTRQTALSTSATDGTVGPFQLPIKMTFAASSQSPALASLQNEDNAKLSIGIASATTPAALTQQAGTNTATYPNALGAGEDLSLRPTVAGLNLQVVLQRPPVSNSVMFNLATDTGDVADQEASGAIVIKRQVPACGSGGCQTGYQPEYIVEAPSARDSSTDPAASYLAQPAATVITGTATIQSLAVTIDAGWLHDPRRVYSVTVDVPIASAPSVTQPGTFSTVNSCAPAVAAPTTDVIVGMVGPCTYHGILFFDMSAPALRRTITAATLHLYTPDQTTGTAVLVYPGTPPATQAPAIAPAGPPLVGLPGGPPPVAPATISAPPVVPNPFPVPPTPSYQRPTWASAPPIAPGSAGVPQGAGTGGWQVWDVTGLAQPWIAQGYSANGGLVLQSSAAPTTFAAVATGARSSSMAPYLELTFARTPVGSQGGPLSPAAAGVSPLASDVPNQATTAGLSGGLFTDWGDCLHDYACVTYPNGPQSPNFNTAYQGVAALGMSYIRGGQVTLGCSSTQNQALARWQPAYTFSTTVVLPWRNQCPAAKLD